MIVNRYVVSMATPGEQDVLRRLSTLDRLLPLWIALAMAGGLVLGSLIPGLNDILDDLKVGTVSLPIALGLLLMMYPVLTKVRYEDMGRMRSRRTGLFGVSLFLSWVVGPLLMFALAWMFLADEPAYRTGVIVVGLARCIAMVLVWNDLAGGDNDRAAILVVFNAIFQVVAYALLGWFYLNALPDLLGLDTQGFEVGIWEVARTVLIFLGIPLAAGYLTRRWGLRTHGREWFESTVIPRIAPITLYGLLFTIVLLFAIQGDAITARPAHRRADRAAAAGVLPDHVDPRLRGRPRDGLRLSEDGDDGLHGRLQRLRARHRGRGRRLGRHVRSGARRRRRPADRGARPRRARLRRAVAAPALVAERRRPRRRSPRARKLRPRLLRGRHRMTQIAINGFGRMGRLALRAAWERPDLDVRARQRAARRRRDRGAPAHVRLGPRPLGPRRRRRRATS